MVKKTVVVTDEENAKIRATMKRDQRSFSFVIREALGEFFKIDPELRHGEEE